MSQIYSHLDREELDLSFFIFTTPYVCIDLFPLYFHWDWMITKASSCCFSELPDFTSSKNIGETTITRKCMHAIHQTLLGPDQAPVTLVQRQITHNTYVVAISQHFKLLYGFWYSAISWIETINFIHSKGKLHLTSMFWSKFCKSKAVLLKKKCVPKKQLFYSTRTHSFYISNKCFFFSNKFFFK